MVKYANPNRRRPVRVARRWRLLNGAAQYRKCARIYSASTTVSCIVRLLLAACDCHWCCRRPFGLHQSMRSQAPQLALAVYALFARQYLAVILPRRMTNLATCLRELPGCYVLSGVCLRSLGVWADGSRAYEAVGVREGKMNCWFEAALQSLMLKPSAGRLVGKR